MLKRNNLLQTIFKICIFAGIIYFLFLRFQLGLTRYFDIDEFAHLHWGYSLYAGEKPYTDFFYLFPPFFLYPIAFIYSIFGRTITSIVQARVLMFLVFCATSLVFYLLVRKIRNSFFALFSLLLFVFLPLPSDKMLEIRPDNPGALLNLLAIYFFVKGVYGYRKYYFFSGLCYMTALAFVPKTIFFLIPPILILLFSEFHLIRKGLTRKSPLFIFILGFLPIIVLILLLLMSFGNPLFGIYSMTTLSAISTKTLGAKYFLMPNMFFYTSDAYYGVAGYNLPYFINLIIYISTSIYVLFKFISSLSIEDRRKRITEFLTASSFVISLIAFIKIYPLKHVQYLIPIAPFVAFYFTDLVFKLLLPLKKAGMVFLLLITCLVVTGGAQMYREKLKWGNRQTLDNIAKVWSAVPATEKIFDLTGETVFYKNGSYFCCVPYGQYIEALTFYKSTIDSEMKKRKTNYVFVGWSDRLNVIPSKDKIYIENNFKNFFPDGSLMIRK